MSTKWTDNQKRAIDASGHNILVSAAAGSGKTAVLVERVIKKITDRENPVSVDNLLIVTYTKAAAAEMRERIFAAVTDEINKNPQDKFLRSQLMLLGQAQITTIHAFCKNLIKSEFHRIGISADFEIGDEAVLNTLKKEAVSEILEERYASPNEEFINLADNFGGSRDDSRLVGIILEIYDFIKSIPDSDEWIEKTLMQYECHDESDFTNMWGGFIIPYVKTRVKMLLSWYDKALDIIEYDDGINGYYDCFAQDKLMLSQVLESLDEGWDKIFCAVNNIKFDALKGKKRGCSDDSADYVKKIRENAKKYIDKLKSIFSADCVEICEENRMLYGIVKELCNLIVDFSNRFTMKKQEKNLLDFNDLEHYTLDLLSDREFVNEYSNKFDEILVDEYQDTNGVQSKIFETISNGSNLFLVGDVKQCIYEFRNACPENFIKKFNLYSDENNEHGERITLSHNFRSANTVIDDVNVIFNNTMNTELGGIDYDNDNMLVFGNKNMESTDNGIGVILTDPYSHGGEELNAHQREGMVIAQNIHKLVSVDKHEIFDKELNTKRPVRYSDIAILMRGKGDVETYASCLSLYGIPVYSENDGGYFATTEIAVVMSFLEIIDNPMQDVPLLAVLRSPMVGFTDNELAELRGKDKYSNIYFCLKNSDNPKAKKFLSTLNDYIKIAEYKSVSKVINRIYTDTGYISFVSNLPSGTERAANLRLLLQRACDFEKGNGHSVSDFIGYVNMLKENGSKYTRAKLLGENDDVVRIMTIHKSKGLEFPVVFVSKCGIRFNLKDLYNPVIFDEGAGIGLDVINIKKGYRYKSVTKAIIEDKKKRAFLSEELRVLYVALTRARDKLFVTADVSNAQSKITELCSDLPHINENSLTYIDWILPYVNNENIKYSDILFPEIEEEGECVEKHEISEGLYNEIDERLSYEYPYEFAKLIPSKMSVSEIAQSGMQNIHLTKFSLQPGIGENAAVKGTVIHFFMQNIDLNKVNSVDEIKSEILRMESTGMINSEQKDMINPRAIADFFESHIGKRMVESNNIRREYRFFVEMPADSILEKIPPDCEETIVIQGVIDCFFEEDGEIVIIDYKTGSMREEYKKQISVYEACIEKATGLKVRETVIYPLI